GWRFRKSARARPEGEKRLRNRVYLACGVVMAVSLILFAARGPLLPSSVPSEFGFLCEWVALTAFAVSWLLKSDYLPFLRDRPEAETAFNLPAPGGKGQTGQGAWRSTVRDGPIKSAWMWCTGAIDRAVGWDRLRVLPALLVLLGLRMRLRRQNLF